MDDRDWFVACRFFIKDEADKSTEVQATLLEPTAPLAPSVAELASTPRSLPPSEPAALNPLAVATESAVPAALKDGQLLNTTIVYAPAPDAAARARDRHRRDRGLSPPVDAARTGTPLHGMHAARSKDPRTSPSRASCQSNPPELPCTSATRRHGARHRSGPCCPTFSPAKVNLPSRPVCTCRGCPAWRLRSSMWYARRAWGYGSRIQPIKPVRGRAGRRRRSARSRAFDRPD